MRSATAIDHAPFISILKVITFDANGPKRKWGEYL